MQYSVLTECKLDIVSINLWVSSAYNPVSTGIHESPVKFYVNDVAHQYVITSIQHYKQVCYTKVSGNRLVISKCFAINANRNDLI